MAKKHVHKYHRVKSGGSTIWACALPDCNHYMPKHLEGILPGKATYCWKCGEISVLDKENMKYDMPWCLECRMNDIAGLMHLDNDNPRVQHEPQMSVVNKDTEKSEVIIDQKVIANLFK